MFWLQHVDILIKAELLYIFYAQIIISLAKSLSIFLEEIILIKKKNPSCIYMGIYMYIFLINAYIYIFLYTRYVCISYTHAWARICIIRIYNVKWKIFFFQNDSVKTITSHKSQTAAVCWVSNLWRVQLCGLLMITRDGGKVNYLAVDHISVIIQCTLYIDSFQIWHKIKQQI